MSIQGGLRPRAHGMALSTEDPDHFTGRAVALAAVAGWLGPPITDPSALVVTGASGSGKSALLATWRRHAFDVALNAHGHTGGEILRALCAAAGCAGTRRADLVSATRTRPLLSDRRCGGRGGDPGELVDTLLAPLARLLRGAGFRLLLGMRSAVGASADSVSVVDLDSEEYGDPAAVVAFVGGYLRRRMPAGATDLINELSASLAAKAGPSFFTAQVIVRNLADRGVDPGGLGGLPCSPVESVAWDLRSRFSEADRIRAEDLLAPLAFARGAGLPWDDVWAPAAAGASGRRYDDLDLAWVRRELGWYILEVADAGHLRYRLWHEVVADYLRGTRDACRTHEAIASALIRRVPEEPQAGATGPRRRRMP